MQTDAQPSAAPAPADPSRPTQMRAVVQRHYGPPDGFDVAQIARPMPGVGEVLVRVRAAGVDRGVWHLTTGLPYAVRLAGYGLRRPKNPVPGMDLAGVVEAVGDGVTGFRPGDEVFGIGKGTFAEYACASASKLAHKPAALSFEQAAVVAISGLTALQAVRDHGRVEAGQRVLVIGASGGVGSFAVQIAVARGAQVTGVCSSAKADLVRSLGAEDVIDYRRNRIGADGQRYDVILDTGGNSPLGELRQALTPAGRLVIVGGEGGDRWLGGTDRQLRAMALSLFVRQSLGTFISSENRDDLLELAALIEAGDVRPALETTFTLDDAALALAHLTDGHACGKVAVTI